QEPVAVHHPSWVAVGPPDFAPRIDAIITLYDVAFQAAVEKGALHPDNVPSFRRHIKPLIERATALRWIHDWDLWNALLPLDLNALANTGSGSAALRNTVAERLKDPSLNQFIMPAFIEQYVDKWAAGNFISDLNTADPAVPVPDQLDRAALDGAVG